MDYEIRGLSLYILPKAPVVIREYISRFMEILGFYGKEHLFEKHTDIRYYDYKLYFHGISIKVPKDDQICKHGFEIFFGPAGVDYYQFSIFLESVFDICELFSDTCSVRCNLINIDYKNAFDKSHIDLDYIRYAYGTGTYKTRQRKFKYTHICNPNSKGCTEKCKSILTIGSRTSSSSIVFFEKDHEMQIFLSLRKCYSADVLKMIHTAYYDSEIDSLFEKIFDKYIFGFPILR